MTDCVAGETYVRGAAGRMAAEIEVLRAHVAVLQQENNDLKPEVEPRPDLQNTDSPDFLAAMTSLQNQQIVALQQDNDKLPQRNRMHREDKCVLKRLVEEQEGLLRLTEVGLLYALLISRTSLTNLKRTCRYSTRRSIGLSRSGQHS